MPRLSKVEACLLCAAVPCECNGKSKKAPRPKAQTAPKQAPAMQSVDRAGGTSMRDKMKAAAAQAPPVAPISAPASRDRVSQGTKRIAPPQPPSPNPDAALAVAIRNLAPLLHEDELKRYSVIIGSRTTTADRAAFWRACRND